MAEQKWGFMEWYGVTEEAPLRRFHVVGSEAQARKAAMAALADMSCRAIRVEVAPVEQATNEMTNETVLALRDIALAIREHAETVERFDCLADRVVAVRVFGGK